MNFPDNLHSTTTSKNITGNAQNGHTHLHQKAIAHHTHLHQKAIDVRQKFNVLLGN